MTEGNAMAVPRLKAMYNDTIRPAMMETFGYRNIHAVPRLDKIVLNMGVGDAVQDFAHCDHAGVQAVGGLIAHPSRNNGVPFRPPQC